MSITIKLRDDHDGLLGLVAAFHDIVAQPVPPAGFDLLKFRHDFSKQLLAHLTREDWLLYPSLLQSSDPVISSTAQTFIDEMGGLLNDYKSWSARWTADRIGKEWVQFGKETADLLDALAERIGRENDHLYPLVERKRSHAA
ncbi:MAG: hemerythrin domain-containing protein [Sphingorhabdus sp.]